MTADPAPALERAVVREIAELHAFFEAWLGGRVEDRAATFGRLEAALAPGFTMVTPEGRSLDRAAVVGGVRQGHGGRRGLAIRTSEARILHLEGAAVLASYEEWQRDPGRPELGRLSSVLFRRDADAANGVVWLHVHETRLPRS